MHCYFTWRLVWACQLDLLPSICFLLDKPLLSFSMCDISILLGKCLASIGFPRDGYICLWDWRSKILMTKIKASSQYPAFASVSFSLDTKFIVTAGKKHLRFWKVGSPPNSRASTRSTSVAMQGKPINLGHCEGFSFVAVTAPSWTKKSSVNHIHAAESPIYALTDTGNQVHNQYAEMVMPLWSVYDN